MKKRSPFSDSWKDYFSFSRRERRGILILLLVILLQIGFLFYLNYFPSSDPERDFKSFKKETDAFYEVLDQADDSSEQAHSKGDSESKRGSDPEKEKQELRLFPFNPNNLPAADWQQLGFSEKQINVIKNYESKGGKFYSKENLKKMYCISDEQFHRIEPYIRLPEKKPEYPDTIKRKNQRPPLMVDIGIADSIELTKLKGIGPGFARRISVYRDKLGGFIRKEQLLEVWGLSDSLYQSLLAVICLRDSDNIRKLNINNASFDDLRIHPYIGYQFAGLICNYRKQHNGFKSVDEIKKIPLVNDQLYGKLAPYLKAD